MHSMREMYLYPTYWAATRQLSRSSATFCTGDSTARSWSPSCTHALRPVGNLAVPKITKTKPESCGTAASACSFAGTQSSSLLGTGLGSEWVYQSPMQWSPCCWLYPDIARKRRDVGDAAVAAFRV